MRGTKSKTLAAFGVGEGASEEIVGEEILMVVVGREGVRRGAWLYTVEGALWRALPDVRLCQPRGYPLLLASEFVCSPCSRRRTEADTDSIVLRRSRIVSNSISAPNRKPPNQPPSSIDGVTYFLLHIFRA